MKYTQYFLYTRQRPDRSNIKDEWIDFTIKNPIQTEINGQKLRMKESIYVLYCLKMKTLFAMLSLIEALRRIKL